jgi:catecholate siderophore receptor
MGIISLKRSVLHRPTAVASAVSLALISSLASAQQSKNAATPSVDEVVVEGRSHRVDVSSDKFTAPLLDTPKSVSIVPAALISEQGGTSLVDALKNVPGVTFNAGEGGQPAGDNL